MKFIVKCLTDPSHNDFWTSVPVTTYWCVMEGKMVHTGSGKLWNPNEKDVWFCQICGIEALVEEL